MTTNPVSFGTDGWRALIADTFTFENVRACAAATAAHFESTHGTDQPVIVGYDTRFLSDEFALAVARVLAGNGFRVQLANGPAPTPAISYRVIEAGACGGVVVTSSHNPYNWNGIKVKPFYGGSASPEVVTDIEGRVPAFLDGSATLRQSSASDPAIERFDPLPGYLSAVSKHVDLDRIKGAGIKLAVDAMYGTGMGLFPRLLEGGDTTVTELHAYPNPRFPGIRAPEPIESNLGEFMAMLSTGEYTLGLANDGDADRLGVVDQRGGYVDQLRTFAILVNYMLGERGLQGAVVKSVTTTGMARQLAIHYGVDCYETPVGFKHIGPLMMEKDALIGGEESGGYGFRGHLPERDGILAGLMVLDYVAATGDTPTGLLERVFAITGEHHYKRIDIDLDPATKADVQRRLDEAAPTEIAGMKVTASDRTDGWRFEVEPGWLLFRLSGTEPLLRIYTEVRGEEHVEPLLAAGRELAGA